MNESLYQEVATMSSALQEKEEKLKKASELYAQERREREHTAITLQHLLEYPSMLVTFIILLLGLETNNLFSIELTFLPVHMTDSTSPQLVHLLVFRHLGLTILSIFIYYIYIYIVKGI